MSYIISLPHVFYLLIDCNGALLSLFQVFEAVVQHMISNDVYLHLDFISNSHRWFWTECVVCYFSHNNLKVPNLYVLGDDSQWGQAVSMGRPWEWFGALGSAV